MTRNTQIIYYLGLILAFSYVIIRGFTVGITHDEALTYKIIQGDEILKGTANHHWLNTQLSALSAAIFGAKEFALRLPNILSFAIFWLFLFRISGNFLKSSHTQLALLLLLCGNPFILDFFSLCRGYGLSLAFVTASLFYLFQIVGLKTESRPIHYYLSAIFSILALSANLNTLNYFLILQALIVVSAIVFKPRNRIVLLIIILILSGVSLYFSLERLFFLRDQNELYFGTGELNSSIDNLIYSSFYFRQGFEGVSILRYGLYILLLFAGFFTFRKKQLFNPGTIVFVVLVSIFIALVAEHYLFEALYPINRSSLYLYPVILLAFLLNIDGLKMKLARVTVILSSWIFILVSLPVYNFNNTMTWSEDSAIKTAMLLIKNDIKDNSIHLAECSWFYEPLINYYRLEYQVPIQEVFRDEIKHEAEYLLIQNEWAPNKNYRLLFSDRNSRLTVHKRKPISAN
jgi:4-amino-4-deoxy-L-arabinose transferase-like glycosyltransferase